VPRSLVFPDISRGQHRRLALSKLERAQASRAHGWSFDLQMFRGCQAFVVRVHLEFSMLARLLSSAPGPRRALRQLERAGADWRPHPAMRLTCATTSLWLSLAGTPLVALTAS
jgi:hypothetical protein